MDQEEVQVQHLQVRQHIDDHENGGEKHGRPAAVLRRPLPVQAVEEGSEERACQRSPGHAHHLRNKNVDITLLDLCRTDASEAISQAFKYDKMVLCASSYDAGLFPPMHTFLHKLSIKGYQSRRVALVENGTWAPTAGKVMCHMLEAMKNIQIVSPSLTIRSAWKETDQEILEHLLEELLCN